MDDIKDIIKKVFADISSKTIAEQKKLGEIFEKVLKDNNISGAKISGFKDGHLFVSVDSSARLYGITVLRNKILTDLKKEMPEIEKISFKIGPIT